MLCLPLSLPACFSISGEPVRICLPSIPLSSIKNDLTLTPIDAKGSHTIVKSACWFCATVRMNSNFYKHMSVWLSCFWTAWRQQKCLDFAHTSAHYDSLFITNVQYAFFMIKIFLTPCLKFSSRFMFCAAADLSCLSLLKVSSHASLVSISSVSMFKFLNI